LSHITLRDANDKPGIGPAQMFARALSVEDQTAQVPAPAGALLYDIGTFQAAAGFETALYSFGQVNLVGGCQQRLLRHLPKIKSDWVVGRYGAEVGYDLAGNQVASFKVIVEALGRPFGPRSLGIASEFDTEFA
jgi:hypothetical protein